MSTSSPFSSVRPIAALRLKLSVVMLCPNDMHEPPSAPRKVATTLRATSMRRSTSREGAKLPCVFTLQEA